jgi:hypothetical protein
MGRKTKAAVSGISNLSIKMSHNSYSNTGNDRLQKQQKMGLDGKAKSLGKENLNDVFISSK